MYQLTEKHIDYILNDISARGVEMESLQQNLVDHVCCIIEQNLEADGDFESFYQKTIKTFYKDALWEIEEETISLLIFKNYYTMKKMMIWSGALSVLTLTVGIIFKYMYWPGATILVCLGILSGSLLFLPLLFTLKAKEKQKTKDKLVMGIGALGIILVSLSLLFKVMHWSYSIQMMYLSAAIMLLVFLPIYFFSGIRNPETKLNTITTSFLVIMVYGLFFMMLRTPSTALHKEIMALQELGVGEEILLNEIRLAPGYKGLSKDLHKQLFMDLASVRLRELHEKLYKLCGDGTNYLIWQNTNIDTTSNSHEYKFDQTKRQVNEPFNWDQVFQEKLDTLNILATEYNLELSKIGSPKLSRIRIDATLLDKTAGTYMLSEANVRNQLIQIQMFILQNTRMLLQMQKKLNG